MAAMMKNEAENKAQENQKSETYNEGNQINTEIEINIAESGGEIANSGSEQLDPNFMISRFSQTTSTVPKRDYFFRVAFTFIKQYASEFKADFTRYSLNSLHKLLKNLKSISDDSMLCMEKERKIINIIKGLYDYDIGLFETKKKLARTDYKFLKTYSISPLLSDAGIIDLIINIKNKYLKQENKSTNEEKVLKYCDNFDKSKLDQIAPVLQKDINNIISALITAANGQLNFWQANETNLAFLKDKKYIVIERKEDLDEEILNLKNILTEFNSIDKKLKEEELKAYKLLTKSLNIGFAEFSIHFLVLETGKILNLNVPVKLANFNVAVYDEIIKQRAFTDYLYYGIFGKEDDSLQKNHSEYLLLASLIYYQGEILTSISRKLSEIENEIRGEVTMAISLNVYTLRKPCNTCKLLLDNFSLKKEINEIYSQSIINFFKFNKPLLMNGFPSITCSDDLMINVYYTSEYKKATYKNQNFSLNRISFILLE